MMMSDGGYILMARLTDLRGLRVRSRRNTRNMPNIRGELFAVRETRMSIRDMPTNPPSIMFQPLLRYDLSSNRKP